MPYNHYLQVSEERYDVLCQRFEKYFSEVDDINKAPFKLFDPLNSQQIQELELIREVSKELHIKKEEDKKRVAEAELEAAKFTTEKTAETNETEDNKTEKKEIQEQTEVKQVSN